MQSINVFENGIGYLGKCLSLYLGNCAYLLLFLCGIIYIIVKGNKEQREIFVPGAVLMLLTVYNPLFPVVIDKFFDISSEYYRFFWMTPVIVLVPFVASNLIDGAGSKIEKMTVIVFLIITVVFAGNFVYENGISLADNIYKIPDELIEIDKIIHSDTSEEYPKAFFEYEYNMEIRQYDPKMLLTIDREEYIYAVNYSYTDEMINDDEVPTNRILASLVRNQDVDAMRFKDALEATKTEYVVVTAGHYRIPMLKEAGLRLIGSTGGHEIYKYDLTEPGGYELIDYTDVEHKFSYRRLK